MSRAPAGRDLDEQLVALEEAIDELRGSLREPGHEHALDVAQGAAQRPNLEVAFDAAAAALEANARALALLAEAIRSAGESGRHRGRRHRGPQGRLDRALDELEAVVGVEGPGPAQELLAELRRLNAEIAGRADAGADENGGREVEIAVESELESIRDELESPEE